MPTTKPMLTTRRVINVLRTRVTIARFTSQGMTPGVDARWVGDMQTRQLYVDAPSEQVTPERRAQLLAAATAALTAAGYTVDHDGARLRVTTP